MDKMHLKLVSFLLISFLLVLGGTAIYFARKYYLSYNLLRLDPLEDKSFKKGILVTPENISDIWMIGDSRMARWNKDLLSPLNAKIVNLGIEGQTTSQVLSRLKNYLETENPKWLILEAGINDLKIIGLKKDLAPSLAKGCLENIIETVALCNKKDIDIIIINIFPTGNIDLPRLLVWNSSVDPAIREANMKLKAYCENNQILFFDTYDLLCTNNFKIKKQYQDGFLHINQEGYKVLSQNLINKFGAIINSKLTNYK